MRILNNCLYNRLKEKTDQCNTKNKKILTFYNIYKIFNRPHYGIGD